MMDASTASLSNGEEIKPYKIHVSSKYLDLTKKKLELTRLPHELHLSGAREWEYGTPKSAIEPLIDFWLEQYSWRLQEAHLNNSLPQFRTALRLSSSPTAAPLRIHFLHIRSQYTHAVPLLLIPSFPLTNLSLVPLFSPLTDPPHPTSTQPFHLVVPSIPGLGFSDAFPTTASLLSQTAEIFDSLMKRLGYSHYLCSSTGSGTESPANIDYHLARLVGENFRDSCLGTHLIAPPISAPSFRGRETWAWVKFGIARFFHAPIWGYEAEDFAALKASSLALKSQRQGDEESQPLLSGGGIGYGAAGMIGLREPNSFAYALCDSPVGLLSLVCSALRRKSPMHKMTKTEVIDVTQLAWLPGPEAGMRFWASAEKEVKDLVGVKGAGRTARVAISVFGVDGVEGEGYVCPAWAGTRHEVIFAQRVGGRAGLLIWERSKVVIDGIRGLAREVERLDGRLMARDLQEVVIEQETNAEEGVIDEEDHGMQLDVESPDTVVAVEMA